MALEDTDLAKIAEMIKAAAGGDSRRSEHSVENHRRRSTDVPAWFTSWLDSQAPTGDDEDSETDDPPAPRAKRGKPTPKRERRGKTPEEPPAPPRRRGWFSE